MTSELLIEAAMAHLSALGFVRDVVRRGSSLQVETSTGGYELTLELKLHDLGRVQAERAAQLLVARAGAAVPVILAPRIGPEVGQIIRHAGAGYIDARGNLDVALGSAYEAHIEGRSGDVVPAPGRSLGLAGYRVLFTLLATPARDWPSIRALAEAAGVSRQPVSDAVTRLRQDGSLVRTSRGYALLAQRYERVLEAWLAGYLHVVRPKLLIATLRRPEAVPSQLELAVAPLLDAAGAEWRYGGTAAGYRLAGHYRGDLTVVHVERPPANLARTLGARPDPHGNLIVMSVPSAAAMEGPEVVHPLLVYTELMASPDERARESARDLSPLFVPAIEPLP
jgi:hypothetical protein